MKNEMKRFGVNKLGSLELVDGFHHERGNVDEFNLVEEWSSSDSVLMLFRNIRNNRPLVVAGHHEVKESMSGEVQFSHQQGNVNGRFQFDKKFSCDLNGIDELRKELDGRHDSNLGLVDCLGWD
jgi:hypothetical protein